MDQFSLHYTPRVAAPAPVYLYCRFHALHSECVWGRQCVLAMAMEMWRKGEVCRLMQCPPPPQCQHWVCHWLARRWALGRKSGSMLPAEAEQSWRAGAGAKPPFKLCRAPSLSLYHTSMQNYLNFILNFSKICQHNPAILLCQASREQYDTTLCLKPNEYGCDKVTLSHFLSVFVRESWYQGATWGFFSMISWGGERGGDIAG